MAETTLTTSSSSAVNIGAIAAGTLTAATIAYAIPAVGTARPPA